MKLRLFILSGLCAWIGVSCGGKKENTGQESIRPVRVVKVESLGAMQKMYTGVVQAEEYSKLAFKVSGPLVEMNVDAGQKVKKGTVIAAVDPLDYNLQFEANKAAYVTSKLQMERNKKLLAMQAISKQDYEIAEANYVKAKSAYETSQNTLADTKLRAPFDGFVEQKYVENYQKVQPGESIIKLVNPDKLEVGFILPETNVRLTREKMQVAVEFDTYKGKWFKAEVKEFVDASPDGSGIPVRLAITDKSYITNSYHVHVSEQIDAFTKLKFESDFQRLSPGGAISYVEVPNMQDNLEAVISVLQFIYDNIMYAELNTKSDYCQVCGYDGEIKIVEDDGKLVWECPKCGNRDQNKLNVARRTCGYIGTQFWNQGRTQEIKDRVLHL